jgi:hypothetical protein
MVEWSEDYRAAICFLNSNIETFGRLWLNWRPGGTLRWQVKTVGWEGRGVVCGKSTPQGCRPRLYRLRTDGLALVSKYWMYRSHTSVYGPSKPSSHRQQMLGFAPTASLVGSGEKLGTDPRNGQPACYWLCRSHFSREQWPYSTLLMTTWKVVICGPREIVRSWTIYGLRIKSVWHVGHIFPCRVYIDLNRHDSQIYLMVWIMA